MAFALNPKQMRETNPLAAVMKDVILHYDCEVIIDPEWIGLSKDLNYNMVGVAVAIVISTMHEKSCIDSHNARKFE